MSILLPDTQHSLYTISITRLLQKYPLNPVKRSRITTFIIEVVLYVQF